MSTTYDDSDGEDKFAGLSVSDDGSGLAGAMKKTRRTWRRGLKRVKSQLP